jgi:hypothetical protein
MTNLSKNQAYISLLAGCKISHNSFTKSEFLVYECGSIMAEDGYKFNAEWDSRVEPYWMSGWKIVN